MKYVIRHFQNTKSSVLVVIWASVSTRGQRRNLHKQINRVRSAVKKQGCTVLKIFTYVGPRYVIPKEFIRCAKFAKSHKAIIVTERSDRYARHKSYHSVLRPELQATREQFTRLCERAGVPLYTIYAPGFTQSQIHRELRKNRKSYPVRKSAGYKKRLKLRKRPLARELHRQGLSLGEIAKELDISRYTIRNWVR